LQKKKYVYVKGNRLKDRGRRIFSNRGDCHIIRNGSNASAGVIIPKKERNQTKVNK